MSEEQETKETEAEGTKGDSGEGVQLSTTDYLKELREVKEGIDSRLAEVKELQAQNILSGKADAGQEPEKPKEESAEDYAKGLLEGSLNKEDAPVRSSKGN